MPAEALAVAVIILLFSVILHEVMHGWAALQFGDHTAEHAGRLTLNPLPHIDLIGTIIVPALFILPALFGAGTGFIIGWAKPVPVNPFNFRDIRRGELVVSAAGVLINLGLAILAATIFRLTQDVATTPIIALLEFTVGLNLLLAIFNSLPIPPLDGSKILMSFLPVHLATRYRQLERYGMIILLFLMFFPLGPFSLLDLMRIVILSLSRLLLGV